MLAGEILGPIGDKNLELNLIPKTKFEVYQEHKSIEELKKMAKKDKDVLMENLYKNEHDKTVIKGGAYTYPI